MHVGEVNGTRNRACSSSFYERINHSEQSSSYFVIRHDCELATTGPYGSNKVCKSAKSVMDGPAAISLAQVTLQHDIQNVFNDVKDGTSPGEDVWISCYHTDRPSVHGFVTIARIEGNVSVSAKPGSLVDLVKSDNVPFFSLSIFKGVLMGFLRIAYLRRFM